jgi:polyadenylate-binding protein
MQQFEEAKHYEHELYFGDLSNKVFDMELFNFIERNVGKPLSAKVIINKVNNQHKGFGYAAFKERAQAEDAIQKLNNQELMGQRVRVMWKNSNKKSGEVTEANLFVKNLADTVSEQDLSLLFSEHGKVISVKVERYSDGKSRGMAYVQLQNKEQAQAAIEALDKHELQGKALTVCPHVKKFDRTISPGQEKFTNLFVRGLAPGTDKEKFSAQFSRFGEVVDCRVMAEKDGSLKNIGLINFKDPKSAQDAIKSLDGKKQEDGSVLYLSKHLSKRELEHQAKLPNS